MNALLGIAMVGFYIWTGIIYFKNTTEVYEIVVGIMGYGLTGLLIIGIMYG